MLWRSSSAKRRPPGIIELCSLLSASLLSACLMGFALLATGGAALAHHSFSPFDLGNSTELEGTVMEFKFINPHTYIVLKGKGPEGRDLDARRPASHVPGPGRLDQGDPQARRPDQGDGLAAAQRRCRRDV